MLGGVQLYKEPFLFPAENLAVGLGDTRKISVSNGLQERTEGQGVIDAREDIRAQQRPREMKKKRRPRVTGPGLGLQLHILDPLGGVSQMPSTLRALRWPGAAIRHHTRG